MDDHNAYSDRFDRAVALAVEAFRPVFRKGSHVPYITHLMMVCAIVGEHGGDEDQMIAAVLHDYLEDIDGSSLALLHLEFGPMVAEYVLALSDTTTRPKPPWRERKEAYLALLPHKDPAVKLICAADKLHNCRTLIRDHGRVGDEIFERFRPAKEETLWYYRESLAALGHEWEHPILGELEEEVRRLHQVTGHPL
jgi:(p)ppGpp synthase/HD superfamily hydrolase